MSEKMGLDLDDVENYPSAVFEVWKEKQAKDQHLKRKEEIITKTEDKFHKYASNRVTKLK